MNSWNTWLRKNWTKAEPAMKASLKKAFGRPQYTDEFEDIIQQFVTYLLGKEEGSYEERPLESNIYLLCNWCVLRGQAMRARKIRHAEVSLEGIEVMAEGSLDDALVERDREKEVNRLVGLVEGHFSMRDFNIWQGHLKGLPHGNIAKSNKVSVNVVNTVARNVKQFLMEEMGN